MEGKRLFGGLILVLLLVPNLYAANQTITYNSTSVTNTTNTTSFIDTVKNHPLTGMAKDFGKTIFVDFFGENAGWYLVFTIVLLILINITDFLAKGTKMVLMFIILLWAIMQAVRPG